MARISKCKHGRYMAFCDECYPKGRLLQGWQEGYNKLNKQHKWYNEIVAWAGGEKIEECRAGIWYQTDYPTWHDGLTYRIKPQPKEPKYFHLILQPNGSILLRTQPVLCGEETYYGKIEVQDD